MSKITLIIPVFNTEKYLNRCIDSVLNQTYKELEIILVNDGSSDNCGKICDEYAKKDNRIKVIHKENGGQSTARNIGLDVATGDYIGFVDSDDWIHPQMYEILYRIITNSDLGFVACTPIKVSEDSCDFKEINIDEALSRTNLYDSDYIIQNFRQMFNSFWGIVCNKLYSRSIFENIRFKEGATFEDIIIILDTIKAAKKIAICPEILYFYYMSPNSTMRSEFSVKKLDVLYAIQMEINKLTEFGAFEQANYYKSRYLIQFLDNYYLIKNNYPHLKTKMKPHLKKYKKLVFKFIKNNPHICRMFKLIYIIFYFSPNSAQGLYKKFMK